MSIEERQQINTVSQFWEYIAQPENEKRKLELINGVIVEVSPNYDHGVIAANVVFEIKLFLRQHKIGIVYIEADHYLPTDKRNTRRPDVGYMSQARAADLAGGEFIPKMPDLAIEVKLPSNSENELRDKAEYYLRNGSRLVWNIFPDLQTLQVYRLVDDTLKVETLTRDATLSGGDVLPGFTVPIANLLER